MAPNLPQELGALFNASDPASKDSAWSEFLKRHNSYLIKTTRFLSRDYDGAMDRYRYVLEELRRDDFKRLRGYATDPRSRFSTWLVAVVRRLCVDYERKRYGRTRESVSGVTREARTTRRRLLDLLAEELHPGRVRDESVSSPEQQMREAELVDALESAVAELGPDDRLLLKLRFEDELPVSKIARVMQLPSVFHVYRRLKPILAELRRRLKETGIHDPYP